ncbi:MAG: hypothetical protein GX154_08970 [Clostridiales bacterium]|nr:hypothetical protein [Clostridiales bacterium]
MNKFLMMYYNLLGAVYIPKVLKNNPEKKLLHVSDTPMCFFAPLKKVIKTISPQIIIHTGDLVDDVKLEIYKNSISKYEYHVKNIISILESSDAQYIYICIGNHDNAEIIKKYCKKSIIIEKMREIDIFDAKASVSHFPYEIIKRPSTYNFFGHDITLKSDIVNNKIYLNGINSINIVTKDTKKIFYLPYPFIVDESRLLKRKIGL